MRFLIRGTKPRQFRLDLGLSMSRLLAYFQLCRFPAVFTALADILLGWSLSHGTLQQPERELPFLLLASAGLYLAGMVWNDIFDRAIDRQERPQRPLPSGRVSISAAVRFGTALLLGGVIAAGAAGWASLCVAGLLVACIFAYDGFLKQSPAGPVVMGSCRLLNVLLGASAAAKSLPLERQFQEIFALEHLHAAAGLGVYIAGVTWFARNEAGTSSKAHLWGAVAVMNLGLAVLLSFLLLTPSLHQTTSRGAILLGCVAFSLNRRLMPAMHAATSRPVQTAVRVALLSLVTLDATLVYFVTGEPLSAMLTLLLAVPALLLGKFMSLT